MAGGASTYQDDDDSTISDINVTPLVDVVLVLLIVFMITMPTIVMNSAIKVELPKAASGEAVEATTLTVTLKRDPFVPYELYANGQPVDEAGLKAAIAPLLEKNPDLQAVVSADHGLEYGHVVHIVDIINGEGVKKCAMSTQK